MPAPPNYSYFAKKWEEKLKLDLQFIKVAIREYLEEQEVLKKREQKRLELAKLKKEQEERKKEEEDN